MLETKMVNFLGELVELKAGISFMVNKMTQGYKIPG